MLYLVAAASVFAVPLPNQNRNECLLSIATQLEASGEEAPVVANATVTACSKDDVTSGKDSYWAMMTEEQRQAMQRLSQQIAYDRALLRVVRIRACRKTPGCSLDGS